MVVTAAASPIARSVLADQVKERLLEAILSGRYAPGARIVETRVADELGTSQAPVREALRDLEALGVVEIAAFRGARVRRPGRAELLEAYVVRTELEVLAARLAIPNLTEADVAALTACVADMHSAVDREDGLGEALADARFHATIVGIGGNRTLTRVWEHLEPFSRTYMAVLVPGSDRRTIAELHVPILEALRGRDPEAAVVALRHHFDMAATMLGARWPDGPAEGAPAGTRAARAIRPSVGAAGIAQPTALAPRSGIAQPDGMAGSTGIAPERTA